MSNDNNEAPAIETARVWVALEFERDGKPGARKGVVAGMPVRGAQHCNSDDCLLFHVSTAGAITAALEAAATLAEHSKGTPNIEGVSPTAEEWDKVLTLHEEVRQLIKGLALEEVHGLEAAENEGE